MVRISELDTSEALRTERSIMRKSSRTKKPVDYFVPLTSVHKSENHSSSSVFTQLREKILEEDSHDEEDESSSDEKEQKSVKVNTTVSRKITVGDMRGTMIHWASKVGSEKNVKGKQNSTIILYGAL
jgi:hypothetical protein